jgi:tripartite-type tricarboxylate transporter receptor subunit TctC
MNGLLKTLLTSVCVGLSLAGPAVAADNYPQKTVNIVVPYTPGGFNDTLGRVVAERLTKMWGSTVMVENRPGGNTLIGNSYVSKSAPDGYTILVTPLPFSALPGLYGEKLPYDALKDFQPLVQAASTQNVLVVRNTLPVNSVKELLAHAKANPGKLNFASTGSGSSNHLSMELMLNMTGTKMTHIPYKGSAPAVTAIIAGEADVLYDNLPNVIQHIKAGNMRALAVTGTTRSVLLPELPTVADAGVPGYEVNVWFGMQLPAGTPQPIVARLNKDIVSILKEPDVIKMFRDRGVEVIASTPEEFSQVLNKDIPKWTKLIKEADIKIQ